MFELLRRSGDGLNSVSRDKVGGEDLGEHFFGEGRAETIRLLDEQKKRTLNPPRVFAVKRVELNIYFYAAIILSLLAGLLIDRYFLHLPSASNDVVITRLEEKKPVQSDNSTNTERVERLRKLIRKE